MNYHHWKKTERRKPDGRFSIKTCFERFSQLAGKQRQLRPLQPRQQDAKPIERL